MKHFASRLQQARRSRGLTQQKLAAKAGVAHGGQISVWERGEGLPRLPLAVAVAHALDVSLDWLCGISESGNAR